jgi:multidrug resistance protein
MQQPNVQRALLLTAVCVALLLDNMLYMVIVPIIPDYLRHIGAWHTHRLPVEHPSPSIPPTISLSISLPSHVNSSAFAHQSPSSSVRPHSALQISSNSSSDASSTHRPTDQGASSLNSQRASVKRPLTSVGGRLVYEGEDGAIGILFASKAVVQLLVNPFSGTLIDRVGAGRPMLFGLLVMFLSTAVFAAGRSYSILLLARSLQGVGSAFADTGGFALLAARFSQPKQREQALGLALSFVSFGCLFAPPFGALLYEFFGKELPFVVLSLVCLMDGLLVLAVLHPSQESTDQAPPKSIDTANQSEMTHIFSRTSDSKTNGDPSLFVRQESAKGESTQAGRTPILNEFLLQQSRDRAIRLKQESAGSMSIESNNNNRSVGHLFPVERANDWNARADQSDSSTDGSSDSSPNKSIVNAVNGSRPMSNESVKTMYNGSSAVAGDRQTNETSAVVTSTSAPIIKTATPIYVLFRDPQIAVCAGALVMANVSLAFLEPTLSIWMVDHLRAEEWQLGLVWLPAFFPYVFGVYSTVRLNHKYPQYKYLVAIGGLLLTGGSCLCLPAVTSYSQLMLPIGSLCFGVAIIDSAVFPTLGYIVDTRYVSVYGSVYAIADISYSLAYAFGPIVAGAIVAWLDFVWLNWIIAFLTLSYCPLLLRLRSVQRYERLDSPELGWK